MELLKVENLTFTYPKQNPDAAEPEPGRFRMYLFRCRKERLWWFAENPDVARPRC